MKKPIAFQSQHKAFTLIELMTVIAIIVILMALLFPALQGVKNSANRASAANDVQQIATAVKAYYTDYGMYPLRDNQVGAAQGSNDDTVYGDSPPGQDLYPNYELFNVLRCPNGWVDNQNTSGPQNPQRVVYLNVNNAKSSTAPVNGICSGSSSLTSPNGTTLAAGDWVDPWGNQYAVFIDANYDGSVSSNSGGTLWFYNNPANPGGGVVNMGVGACSLGKDGTWGTRGNGAWIGSDDVVSWQ